MKNKSSNLKINNKCKLVNRNIRKVYVTIRGLRFKEKPITLSDCHKNYDEHDHDGDDYDPHDANFKQESKSSSTNSVLKGKLAKTKIKKEKRLKSSSIVADECSYQHQPSSYLDNNSIGGNTTSKHHDYCSLLLNKEHDSGIAHKEKASISFGDTNSYSSIHCSDEGSNQNLAESIISDIVLSTSKSSRKYNKIKKPKVKPLSIRKRKELIAIEERRLFGKERSEEEKQMIHRAFLVGKLKLDNVLRSNFTPKSAEYQYEHDSKVSFSSVLLEMKKLSSSLVQNNIKLSSKSLKKIPRSIIDIPDEDIMSPTVDNSIADIDDLLKESEVEMMDFSSTNIPIKETLESARLRVIKEFQNESCNDSVPNREDYKEVDDTLSAYLSPPMMKHVFPCMPIEMKRSQTCSSNHTRQRKSYKTENISSKY